jgi:two-component system, LuxR family, response regulator FixJ
MKQPEPGTMIGSGQIILVDPDVRRRAEIGHALATVGIHSQPFGRAGELIGTWSRADLLLVHDAGTALVDLIEKMLAEGTWIPLVAYAEEAVPRRIVDAVQAGAFDYVVSPFSPNEIVGTLIAAQRQGMAVANSRIRQAMARSVIDRLTKREREVLSHIANGLSNRETAQQLGLSHRTVEIHRANVLLKTGAKSTAEVIRFQLEATLDAPVAAALLPLRR